MLKAHKFNFEENMRQLEEELAGQLDDDELNDDNDNDDAAIPPAKTPEINVNDSGSPNGNSSPSKMVNSYSSYSNTSAASSDKPASPGPPTTVISVTGPGKGIENGDINLVEKDGDEKQPNNKEIEEGIPQEEKVNSQEQLTTM